MTATKIVTSKSNCFNRSKKTKSKQGLNYACNSTTLITACLICLEVVICCTSFVAPADAAVAASPLNQNDNFDHLIRTRSELVNNNIGRDDEGDLRTLSGAHDEVSNDDTILASGGYVRNEIYLLEDKDYPKSLFEDYPRRVGQVSGITTLPTNDVVIFHRSGRHWTSETFNTTSMQIDASKQDDLIRNDTIMILDREDGGSVTSFGANLFYMPHSIASDHEGNLWVSDVARHQVMRLPVSNIRQTVAKKDDTNKSKADNSTIVEKHQIWPDIILGEAFVAGDDEAHFCQPSEVTVSSNGMLVFVADGYCNQRVMVFTGAGRFLTSFGQDHNLTVVHSMALIEERNLLCVADRENGRILCYHAGLDGDYARLGELIRFVDYPLGRVFAITSLSEDHLLVSSNQKGTNRYDLAILNPFTHELKLVWISTDLLEPHSLASTRNQQAAYAADISKDAYKKVFKFNIIKRRD